MAQEWRIDSPRVLDIGDEHERVGKLEVGIVAGRVDVVTHDDSPTARVEVTSVEGLPVKVTWDGATLRVLHGKEWDNNNLMEMLKRTFEHFGRNKVTVSISVPTDASATVATVSGEAVVSGLRSAVKVNSVSGALIVSDITGEVDMHTVSGTVDGEGLSGPASVNSVSGAVTLQRSSLPDVKINTVSGDIAVDLTSGKARVRSNSVSGDVTVRAPLTGFDVEANTASGQIVVDGRQMSKGFGAGPHGHERTGRLREGDGALEIKANAVSGSIVVLRSSSPDTRSGPQDAPVSAPTGDQPTEGQPEGTSPTPQDIPPGEHPADQPTGSATAAAYGDPFPAPSEQPAQPAQPPQPDQPDQRDQPDKPDRPDQPHQPSQPGAAADRGDEPEGTIR
jgi:hypothetical protein